MTRLEPSQSAVRLMSQAGPGPGFGFLDLEHPMVVRAAQLHVHRLAAVAVPDHHGPSLGAGFPSVPPVHQYDQGREQVMTLFGEQVLIAFTLPSFAIRLALQHAVLDERGESLAEQGPRAADVGEELLEAARAVKRLAEHQQRPLLPDDVEGALAHRVVARRDRKSRRLDQQPVQAGDGDARVGGRGARLVDRLERAGNTGPYFHGKSRPIAVEREATHRAISLAELIDVPIVVVHVSNREAMEEIRRAQMRGLKISGETCPQYLVLTEDDLKDLGMEGAKYVCSPPPRDHASQQACWEGIQQGVFSLFSSDHCPFRYDDEAGKLTPNARTSFRWIPNGIPGVETRLPILFSEGVSKGRITLNQFVALTATNHAKTYGLAGKGSIAVGYDADIAIWDPRRTATLTQHNLHHGADYTPYEGIEITGWPIATMLRGRFVVRDGKLVGSKGDGRYVSRGQPGAVSSGSRTG